MGTRGITLIELLVVITVLSILILSLGFSFQGWIGKYETEKHIKELYSDLMSARAMAMQRTRTHFVLFPGTSSYTLYEDDSDGTNKVSTGDENLQAGVGPGADSELPSFPKTLPNQYQFTLGESAASSLEVNFDKRGLVSALRTICIFTDFDKDELSDYDPDYDCIVLSRTRTALGKLKKQATAGGLCNADNCEKL